MTTKTDPNQNFTINEFYIKVKGDYGKEKTVRVNDMGAVSYTHLRAHET